MKQYTSIAILTVLVFIAENAALAGRYYDARSARWTTPDPALRERSPNQLVYIQDGALLSTSPYGYAFSNPIKYVDPTGKMPLLAPAAGVGAAVYIGGAVGIAVAGHVWRYTTNAAYRRAVDQGTSSLMSVAGQATNNAATNLQTLYEAGLAVVTKVLNSESAKQEDATEIQKSDGGVKSATEYDKHQAAADKAKEQLGQLEEKLAKTKGVKSQDPIKQEIQNLKDSIKGHEKEMNQKWPDGRPKGE